MSRATIPLILMLTCAVQTAGVAGQKYTLMEGIDQWQAEMFSGNPAVKHFVQGPKDAAAAGGILVFDKKGNAYTASGTFIQVITADGNARILTGTPGVKGATDGPPWKATFGEAYAIAIDDDDTLYVVDRGNMTLRKVRKVKGQWITSTIAGVAGKTGHRDGSADQALFMNPFDGVAVDEKGVVYVTDGNWLRKIEKGKVTTLNAGTGTVDGPLAKAKFNRIMGGRSTLTYDGKGNLYIADRWSMSIRKVDLKKKIVSTVAGCKPGVKKGRETDGPAFDARFHPGGGPVVIFYNRKHDFIIMRSADEGGRIRVIYPGKEVRTFGPSAGSSRKRPLVGPWRNVVGGSPCGIDNDGNVYVAGARCIRVVRKVTE